jgi:glycyl-tRNA synthetase beta chain
VSPALLFEIGTEELPPSELPVVFSALAPAAERILREARLDFDMVRTYTTPRRLAVLVTSLSDCQLSQVVRVTGPPKRAGVDAQGRYTKAAEGFARTQGVAVDQLITVETERGEYLAAERHETGRPAGEILPELLERLAAGLPFAKQMRWGEGEARFSRPVRWVVALWGNDVLPLAIAGVRAGRTTYGHRFARPEPIPLAEPSGWVERLTAAFVLPDVSARRSAVHQAVVAAAAEIGARAVVDAGTLETVTHLVEYPVAIVGSFAPTYLELPREVVETPIRRHQKCFAVETPEGRLAPHFVTVSNTPGADPAEIRRGNERVIRARLADADFYFRDDLRLSPEARLPLLGSMVFQERLGTLLEKTERLGVLAGLAGEGLDPTLGPILQRAARLAKTDLASGMVREFPELQGIIGEEYARRAGEPRAVARAIREHYLPRGAEDAVPESGVGAALSVADKVDTIVGCLGVGLIPTGSQDPYGLRRQAQGVIQIALSERLPVTLAPLVDRALGLLSSRLTEPEERTRDRAHELFRTRLATALTSRGLRSDVIEAVLVRGFDDPMRALRRAEAVTALVGRPDWEPLVVTFKRTINILPARPIGPIDPGRFTHEAERDLHTATQAAALRVRRALEGGDYRTALTDLAALRPTVDRFFEAVLVMDKDPAIQDNRLALLRGLADLLLEVADLRRIVAAASV